MKTNKKLLSKKIIVCLMLAVLALGFMANIKFNENAKTVSAFADSVVKVRLQIQENVTGDEIIIDNIEGTTYTLPFTVNGWTVDEGYTIVKWFYYDNYEYYLPGETVELSTDDNGFLAIAKPTTEFKLSSAANDDVYFTDLCTENNGCWIFEGFNSDVRVLLQNYSSPTPEGTFLWSELNHEKCYFENRSTEQRTFFTDGSCQITVKNGITRVCGAFSVGEDAYYLVDISYKDPYYIGGDDFIPSGSGTGKGEGKTNNGGNGNGSGVVIALVVVTALLGGAYGVMFFALNKWIIIDGKVVRAFKFGKKENENKFVSFKCQFEIKPDAQVFNTKEDAEKALNETAKNITE